MRLALLMLVAGCAVPSTSDIEQYSVSAQVKQERAGLIRDTVEGNSAQAVAFVVDKVELDIDGVTDWRSAVEWLDSIPFTVGDPLTERWA